MALITIQTDCTTSDARDWLAVLLEDVFDRLDMELCVGLVNGDAIAENIVNQIGYLPSLAIDQLFGYAIESLLE